MGATADLACWGIQKMAPLTVRYGRDLYFGGTELKRPSRMRVVTRHGTVRCDVYTPSEEPIGTYVHAHGGAWVMRYPRMDDFFCRAVAAEGRMTVVNVDYDVAPQVRYPVPHEQLHDVMVAVADGSTGVSSRMAVGGFSAGANVAAGACLEARDRSTCAPLLQMLAVPPTDLAQTPSEKRSSVDRPEMNPRLMNLVRCVYLPEEPRRHEGYASPLLAEDLRGVARALVITAEHDLLRDEGVAYAQRLAEAGALAEHLDVPGVDHYFLNGGRQQARAVLTTIVTTLRRALQV